MNVIEIKNLVYNYIDRDPVINDISFDIEEGSFVSIVGHNGSGKSTLSKLIVGLLTPKSGEIKIYGKTLNPDTVHELRSRIGIVFQNPDNQFISSTVEDDIAFGLENRRVPYENMNPIIKEYAEKVGMLDYLKKEPTMLSGGQKQRVALAGVLAIKPDILILDEATSMLDPRGRKEIREVISKMRLDNPNLTIISITHDIEEAYMSDEVVVISKGKLILKDKPEVVFRNKELLSSASLKPPFLFELKEKLAEKGLDISNVDNIEELLDYICQ